MKNNLSDEVFDVVYSKLQKLAKEYAEKMTKNFKKSISYDQSYCFSNPWCQLMDGFCRGKFSEEDVKYCFLLGYVPEKYRDVTFREYSIPHSLSIKKTTFYYEPMYLIYDRQPTEKQTDENTSSNVL